MLASTLDKLLQSVQMIFERLPTGIGGLVGGTGFTSYKSFLNRDVFMLLKVFEVAGQVTILQIQGFFEGIEVYFLLNHQQRHDPQSYPAFKNFVELT